LVQVSIGMDVPSVVASFLGMQASMCKSRLAPGSAATGLQPASLYWTPMRVPLGR
jgi:hypothetical protein